MPWFAVQMAKTKERKSQKERQPKTKKKSQKLEIAS